MTSRPHSTTPFLAAPSSNLDSEWRPDLVEQCPDFSVVTPASAVDTVYVHQQKSTAFDKSGHEPLAEIMSTPQQA